MNFNLILKYKVGIIRIISLIFCILNVELINAQTPISDSLKSPVIDRVVAPETIEEVKIFREPSDTIKHPIDTVYVADSLEIPKSDIETRIQYTCRDSIRMSMAEQRVYLYGQAKVVYGSKNIEAEYLIINWVSNEVYAYGRTDTTTGRVVGKPVFKDGADMYVADSIRYNMKSGKGIIKGIVTRQGDGYIHGGPVKRTPEAIYVKHALYTTCDLPHPHFSVNANKLKVIPGDKVVTGPFHMEIMGIPTPLGLPLGFFPVTRRAKSGMIFPTIGESRSRGFFLKNGGYYWAVNDYVGAKVVADLYANKSYRVEAAANYIKRYNYSGNTSFSYSKIKEGFADSTKAPELFSFRWNHSTIGNKSARLSADVNISSSKYYTANSYNPINYQSTNFASNVSWSKSFRNSPFNMSVAFRQEQNTLTKIMTATLPEVNFSMNRVYPFKSNVGTGDKWYEKIYISYNGSTKYSATNNLKNGSINGVEYKDTTLAIQDHFQEVLDNGQWGVKNMVPIGTSFKLLRYLSLNPSIALENWIYGEKLRYDTLTTANGTLIAQPQQESQKGLNTAFSGNFSVALTTRIYGMYRINSKVIQGIRHTLIPTFTYTYRPDIVAMSGDDYFYTNPNLRSSNGDETPYLKYSGYVYSGPQSGTTNSLTFNFQNTLEGKGRDRKDTTGLSPTKKIKLLDNLNITGSYNFGADSLQWSLISVNANSRFFDRIDLNFSSTFDPYVTILDSTYGARRIDKTANDYGSKYGGTNKIAILTNYNIAIGTNLNPNGQKSRQPASTLNPNAANYTMGGADQYVDFNIPWNLTINYKINYIRNIDASPTYVNSLTFKGDIKVSDNWKLAASTGFDIQKQKIGYTTLQIFRDLHCWQMSLNVIPFGFNPSFFFTLSAKSSLLRDLKINKQNATNNGGGY